MELGRTLRHTNPGIYTSNKLKIALILSKMGTGKGVAFSEKWYNKMANSSVCYAKA